MALQSRQDILLSAAIDARGLAAIPGSFQRRLLDQSGLYTRLA